MRNLREGMMPGTPNRGNVRRYKYFRRLLNFRQMDFEFALWQMLYLVVSPNKVYRNAHYQKTHKNQYARDDPAFVVLLAAFLLASSIICAIVFGLSFGQFILFFLWVVFIDCIMVGCIIASCLWWISNSFLRTKQPFAVEEDVEWAYAFDVHCNAFFPLVLILHVLQLFLIGIINHEWFFSALMADSLWMIALCYYFYITFLGYSALPFLNRTTVVLFLFPILLVVATYVVALLLRWNISRTVFKYYGLQED
eukprot:m.98568 g.98568  ORF g.98568 m.98568 type:complete len:252 (-) comp13641_c0_seq1:5443-6198(-)